MASSHCSRAATVRVARSSAPAVSVPSSWDPASAGLGATATAGGSGEMGTGVFSGASADVGAAAVEVGAEKGTGVVSAETCPSNCVVSVEAASWDPALAGLSA